MERFENDGNPAKLELRFASTATATAAAPDSYRGAAVVFGLSTSVYKRN